MVSELNERREEIRKIEYFKDGRVGIASKSEESGSTRLGLDSVPSVAEINSDPQFSAEEITEAEFCSQWDVYV